MNLIPTMRTVRAARCLRKMRGESQAHLIEADDGNSYVVKFANNPQHRRILVNELVSSVILGFLGIASPAAALVVVDNAFLRDNPEVYLLHGGRKIDVSCGTHFGSRYPVPPGRHAVYDFLPEAVLPEILNPLDFRGILVFDKWAANADGRQAVFFRARTAAPHRLGFAALMIDHGYVFGGGDWSFDSGDSPILGLYHRRAVYGAVRSLKDFEPWLSAVQQFPPVVLKQACRQVPRQWLDGDEDELQRLLERLLVRRRRVSDLLTDCAQCNLQPFPNWSGSLTLGRRPRPNGDRAYGSCRGSAAGYSLAAAS